MLICREMGADRELVGNTQPVASSFVKHSKPAGVLAGIKPSPFYNHVNEIRIVSVLFSISNHMNEIETLAHCTPDWKYANVSHSLNIASQVSWEYSSECLDTGLCRCLREGGLCMLVSVSAHVRVCVEYCILTSESRILSC